MKEDYLWDPSAQPDAEIERLEHVLLPLRFVPDSLVPSSSPRFRLSRILLGLAAAAVILLAAGALLYERLTHPAPWSIESINGVARIGGNRVDRRAKLSPGAIVETDSRSTARLVVGTIGLADIGPSSRLRLVRADSAENRFVLIEGTIHARIWARPRYFVVDSPIGTAIDLGCIYTMNVDGTGRGRLSVNEGTVEVVAHGVRALVPSGNTVALHSGKEPGLPYPLRSSAAFRGAVAAADSNGYEGVAIQAILDLATQSETLTLWHLLSRVDGHERLAIYSRLVALAPPPSGVTSRGIISLDPAMLAAWQGSMESSWSVEPRSWWRRFLLRVGLRKPAFRLGV